MSRAILQVDNEFLGGVVSMGLSVNSRSRPHCLLWYGVEIEFRLIMLVLRGYVDYSANPRSLYKNIR